MSGRPLALILVVLAACGRGGGAPVTAEARARLAEEAAIVMESHCGACHMSTLPTALPAALAVFDLSRGAGWDDAMTPARWEGALDRLAHADPDMGRETAATEAELERVRRYVRLRRARP